MKVKFIFPWFLPKDEWKFYDLYSEKFIDHFFVKNLHYDKIVWFHPSEFNKIIEDDISYKKIKNLCKDNNTELEIVLGNFSDRNDIINWPIWTWQYSYINYIKYEPKNINNIIDKPYVCMIRKAKHSRCVLVDELAKHSLENLGYLTWHRVEVSDNHKEYIPYNFKYFDNKKRTYDNIYNSSIPYGNEGFVIQDNFYHKGFVHILPEAITEDTIFIGIKFAQATLHQKPYLYLGTVGIHNKIKELGFELYDEIFDYNFDNKLSLKDRVIGIVDNIKKINNADYNELNNIIKDKLKYNQQHFIKTIKDPKWVPKEFYDYEKYIVDGIDKKYYDWFKEVIDVSSN